MVPDSRGRHELLAILDGLDNGQTEFEEMYGAPQPQISLIVRQKGRPGLALSLKFKKAGIDPAAWHEPPTKAQLAVDRARRAKGAA